MGCGCVWFWVVGGGGWLVVFGGGGGGGGGGGVGNVILFFGTIKMILNGVFLVSFFFFTFFS